MAGGARVLWDKKSRLDRELGEGGWLSSRVDS